LLNLPILLTCSRIIIILPFILITPGNPFLGALIFGLAAITDYLDGYFARKKKQVTKLGILLDPIADKLLVIAALILLVDIDLVPAWIAIVIIAREFIVTGLRIVALTMDLVIPAEMGGKLKVTCQITAIIILLVGKSIAETDFFASLLESLIEMPSLVFYLNAGGIMFLWISMILGVISGIQYFYLFWKRI
jgi:CDP-diacylglycerol--glycerol-3-phosphate 3-phosphatidyltransferase